MIVRVLLGVFSILGIFFLPWWIILIVTLALLFYFENFYEIVIIGILADVLYGSMAFLGFPYPITLGAIICFYFVKTFKRNLIAY